jgi:3-hydroxybutyryl-CoA dehydrogenase
MPNPGPDARDERVTANTTDTLAVIGAGTMGHGIAHVAARAGYAVRLFDVAEEAIEDGLNAIDADLRKGVEKGKVTPEERTAALARIRGERDLGQAVEGAAIVIEAAPEDLGLKKRIFVELAAYAAPETLLATNTSSLPVGQIAAIVPNPGRVAGMHFFNPVHLMPLLEVVKAEQTSDETIARATQAGARMGKECIVVRDVPGFATSRLGVILGLEAMRMLESGVASAADIDKAMTLGYRHPVGPLRLTDLVGLDVRLAIAEHLHRTLGSEAFRPPEILRRMVAEGKLGKKTGRGFYDW